MFCGPLHWVALCRGKKNKPKVAARSPATALKVGDLGGGAHGRVLLAHDNVTSQQVALKFVKRGPDVSL